MILDCPSFTKRFKIPDDALGAEGRKVKCSACGHVWHQVPAVGDAPKPEKIETAAPDPAPEPAAPAPDPFAAAPPSDDPDFDSDEADLHAARMRADVRPLVSRRGAPSHAGGWAAGAALLVALLGGAFMARDTVLTHWPQARTLYAALFLAPHDPTEELEIRALSTERQQADGVETLVIKGEIVNRSVRLRQVPPMQVVLRDLDSRDLVNWTFSPTEAILLPNEVVKFSATHRDPPAEATGASLSFASAEALPEN